MKRHRKRQHQTSNPESSMEVDDDHTTITNTITNTTTTPVLDSEKKNNKNSSKKITISLALDEVVVEEIREEADKSYQSFNAKINAILEKYVAWYRFLELNKGVVIPPTTHQFLVNEIDESKYAEEMKRVGSDRVAALVTQTGTPLTLDHIIKFTFEGLALNSHAITSVSKYVDKNDGKTCIYIRHNFNEKWSRLLSIAFAHHIESLLHYHTIRRTFANGFEIKILESIPL